MKELLSYRVKLIARLENVAREFRASCEAVKDPFAKVAGGWTLHQIASHTRDVQKLVYGARILRTLNEDNPKIENFDADEWMAANYKQEESFTVILDEFIKSVEDLCKTLRELTQEDWSRESRHEGLGNELTLQLWVERALTHIEEHSQSVKIA